MIVQFFINQTGIIINKIKMTLKMSKKNKKIKIYYIL